MSSSPVLDGEGGQYAAHLPGAVGIIAAWCDRSREVSLSDIGKYRRELKMKGLSPTSMLFLDSMTASLGDAKP
ncbi:hypothetical protein [Leptolyngbya sp. FACHB-16]|uniref:hypothetical protein n=1 Tax=unclassified Leptolyngbya TaxID=2650499 RepID=UPI001684096A|nr:hypothetical protein [Leptolyngbya sp. FACHB-16]MBD2156717.1 hypothetical protein [Leptolyngbya sp. FACHB-16]